MGADHLRWCEQATAAGAEPAVGSERGMLGEPAGNGERGRDRVAVARGDFRGALLKRVAAIVERQGFEDFIDRIGLVAHRTWAGRERASARAATDKRDALKLLLAGTLLYEALAVAVRAALRRFDDSSWIRRPGPLGRARGSGRGVRHRKGIVPRRATNTQTRGIAKRVKTIPEVLRIGWAQSVSGVFLVQRPAEAFIDGCD